MHLAALLLAAVVLLAGCGGSDEGTTTTTGAVGGGGGEQGGEQDGGGADGGAKQQADAFSNPRTSVEAALTSQDPDLACGELVTAGYLRAAYGDEQACVAAVRSGSQARSVRIVSVKRSDGRATVKAIPAGGPSAGETLTITAVVEHSDALEGDVWKIDAVRSNVPVGP
jgi:hypothetical protein